MIPKPVVDLVEARSGGVCEGCGRAPATEKHHRKYRSRGGKDTVDNLLHLCGWGNHTGCHGIAHTAHGHQLGWAVNSWADPFMEPYTDSMGREWWLNADGTREPARDGYTAYKYGRKEG